MKSDNRTKITFNYEGENYTLVYSADALKKMERVYKIKFVGLNDRILTAGEDMFIGAFIENHDNVPVETRVKIYESLCANANGGKESLQEVLAMMIQEALDDIQQKGNLAWKVERKA